MRIESLQMDVELRPLSTKQSRAINKSFREFASKNVSAAGEVAVNESEAAEYLFNQFAYLLKEVYRLQDDPGDWEDRVSITEVCAFLKKQIEVNGRSDFLVQPLNLLLDNMAKLPDRAEQLMEQETQKLLNSAL